MSQEAVVVHPFDPYLWQCPQCTGIKLELRITNGDGTERIAILTCMKGHNTIFRDAPKALLEATNVREIKDEGRVEG